MPPEVYNRRAYPSLKQSHDFVAWLREKTVAELLAAREDSEAMKGVFLRFFERGLRAELTPKELMEIVPTILIRGNFSEQKRVEILAMIQALGIAYLATGS